MTVHYNALGLSIDSTRTHVVYCREIYMHACTHTIILCINIHMTTTSMGLTYDLMHNVMYTCTYIYSGRAQVGKLLCVAINIDMRTI